MFRLIAASALLASAAQPAVADVADSTVAGFTVSKTLTIAAPPATVWATLVRPSRWWSKDHTWSGRAANLSIDPGAGCFCELLPGRGKVVHARLIFFDKNRLLRMEGALGPLQSFALTGVLTFALAPAKGGKATTLTMIYAVGGYLPGGLDKMAAPVDAVLGEQLAGLKSAAERTRE